MKATVGCDISHPIEYYFKETSGNPGGNDSGWQTSRVYTDEGLEPNTQYAYTVQMRDALQNTGGVSTAESATTTAVAGTNFFTVSYAGSRSNFTGWVGYEFTPSENIAINGLGRAVSASLLQNHAVRIWRVSDQTQMAAVTVTSSSDTFQGYAYEPLPSSVLLNSGVTYRIASYETSGGDAFRDSGNLASHTDVASISRGVYGSGIYPAAVYGGAETGYGPPTFFYDESATDTDPPSPNPAGFDAAPTALSGTAIAMAATPGSDASGPVEYYFAEISGNPGGTDSGWQASPIYADTDLDPATQYTYTVQMRDALQHTGMVSTAVSAITTAIAGSNFFKVPFAGSRSNFTGWVGYEFTPSEDVRIDALGRSVGTGMLNSHQVKIWRVSDQAQVAAVTVTPSSAIFQGYAYEPLSSTAALNSGVTYRIASSETSGGDAWRDVSTLYGHQGVANISRGVYGNGSYPANSSGNSESGYVPATFFYVNPQFDTDRDGMSDAHEAIAGTNPTNPASYFAITGGYGSGGFVVEWSAVSNRQYQVYRADSLTNAFNPIGPVLFFPQNSYTDSVPRSNSLYKVGVQLP